MMLPLPMLSDKPKGFTFWLGTHHLVFMKRTDVPLFVSRVQLVRYRTPPVAIGPWALDSGAFTELQRYGEFRTDAMTYSTEVRRWHKACGKMMFCSPQDWMCEPIVIAGGKVGTQVFHGTGLSVAEHQRRTVANYLLLRDLAPDMPWIPVLQGYTYFEYLNCQQMYEDAGVRLAQLPLVGLGSVCRRQDTGMVESLIRFLHAQGLKVHAFGMKILGARRCARYLASSDSMAWSRDARFSPPLLGHTHKSCANCMEYALLWREKVLRAIAGSKASEQQLLEFEEERGCDQEPASGAVLGKV